MALTIDGSSPSVATGATKNVSTGTFTPPAGALLLALWAGNSTLNNNPGTPTIADSQTDSYTLNDWQSRANSPTVDGQAASWWALATASTSMTVTSTSGVVASEFHQALGIRVMTGQHATPIGAHGKSGSASAGSIAQNFTATATGSWGFLAVCDWDALGSMTAGTGCTMIGTGTIPTTQISYGLLRRTTADGVNGNTTTMNITLAGTSTHVSWVWVEVVPAATSSPLWIPQQRRRQLWLPFTWRTDRWDHALVTPTSGAPEVPPTPRRRPPITLQAYRGLVRSPVPTPVQPAAPAFPPALMTQPHRLRGLLPRRGAVRAPAPVPVQPAPPPFIPALMVQPRRIRGLLPRRGHAATPVPAQVIVTPPPFVAPGTREHVKALLLRRHTPAGAVTVPIPPPGPVAPTMRRRPATPRLRRPSVDQPPPSQAIPPILAPVRHRVGVIRSRPARAGTVVPNAAALPARRAPHRTLVWARSQLRRFSPPFLVTAGPVIVSVPGSITPASAVGAIATLTRAGGGASVTVDGKAIRSTVAASGALTTATGRITPTTDGGGP